jgi:hypothetical protein
MNSKYLPLSVLKVFVRPQRYISPNGAKRNPSKNRRPSLNFPRYFVRYRPTYNHIASIHETLGTASCRRHFKAASSFGETRNFKVGFLSLSKIFMILVLASRPQHQDTVSDFSSSASDMVSSHSIWLSPPPLNSFKKRRCFGPVGRVGDIGHSCYICALSRSILKFLAVFGNRRPELALPYKEVIEEWQDAGKGRDKLHWEQYKKLMGVMYYALTMFQCIYTLLTPP